MCVVYSFYCQHYINIFSCSQLNIFCLCIATWWRSFQSFALTQLSYLDRNKQQNGCFLLHLENLKKSQTFSIFFHTNSISIPIILDILNLFSCHFDFVFLHSFFICQFVRVFHTDFVVFFVKSIWEEKGWAALRIAKI